MDILKAIARAFEHPELYGKSTQLGIALINIVLMIIVGLIIIKIIVVITRKALQKSRLDEALYTFIINGIKVVLLVTLVTMCLGALGVQMSTLIAVIGAAGAAIALALKDSLANVAGGMMIIITQPFSKDDFIDVGEVSGKVENIDLFLTTLRTYDNKMITIPNGLINTSILINHSRESNRRVDCRFSISYDSDIAGAKSLLMKVCKENGAILTDPEPSAGVSEHGESGIILDLKAWCHTDDYWDVKYYLEERVKTVFDENGIEIPFPHVNVKIESQPPVQ